MNPVKRNLSGLVDFRGRQNREPFWIWVLICYGVQTAVSVIGMIPFMVYMVGKVEVLVARPRQAMPPNPEEMFGDMQPMILGMTIFGLIAGTIFIALLAAAVVRRLHDRNMSGWWAAPVLVLNAISQVSSVSMIAAGKINMTPNPKNPYANMTASFGLLQFLALGSLIALVVFLSLRGTNGPNRFGPDPMFEP